MSSELTVGDSGARIGLLLPTRELVTAGEDLRSAVTIAQDAEHVGYSSVWVGDSAVARPRLEPLTTLAAIAAATTRVQLGTAVLIAALRHPVTLAHTAATLQALSGGRLILGVGAGPSYGPSKKEFAALNVPFANRFGRLIEVVEACRELWTGQEVSFQGAYVRFPRARIEPTPTRVPVWLGTMAEKGLVRAGTEFDGWIPMPPSPTHFSRAWNKVGGSADTAGDRTVEAAPYVTVCITNGAKSSYTDALRSLENYYAQPASLIAGLSDLVVGPASHCADRLAEYAQAGGQHLITRIVGGSTQTQLRSLSAALDR